MKNMNQILHLLFDLEMCSHEALGINYKTCDEHLQNMLSDVSFAF